MTPNQTLDRMTRSAVSRMFQFGRRWRAPRHRSALRSANMKALIRYLILPVFCFGLLCALFVQVTKRFPLYVAVFVGLLLIAVAISAFHIIKKNKVRGWRVGHQGRDQMFYEELRDGRWERIDLDGEMLVGKAHHVIYFSSSRFPAWAEDRREEIVIRIKTEFRPPSYEYEEA